MSLRSATTTRDVTASVPLGGGPPSAIHAYDLAEDGGVRYRRAVVTFPAGNWGDGMTVDAEGRLFVGVGGLAAERGVHVYSPDGRRISFLSTPETAVNLEFGRGPDADILYVTCARHPSGTGPWVPPPTNGLYRIRLQRIPTAPPVVARTGPANPVLVPTSLLEKNTNALRLSAKR